MQDYAYSVQKVLLVRYRRTYYGPECLIGDNCAETTVYELTEGGITTYLQDKGSRKKREMRLIKADPEEMRAFIDELQNFSRKATEAFTLVDDCDHEVQFIYWGAHKEIFKQDISLPDSYKSLISLIAGFVHGHQKEEL